MTDQTLALTLSDGTVLHVPPELSTITTYVLLEQERWFEKEVSFVQSWLKPGMSVIDIGANYGAYSLPMARLVGPTGRVHAYEPTSSIRRVLAQSRDANGVKQLEIIPYALSDSRRTGFLAFGASGELNALGEGSNGEAVEIRSLDDEARDRSWAPTDFIKIDAEGEELRILAGASNLLTKTSPLVMFELLAGSAVNTGLIEALGALGYAPYRQLGGLPLLVPFSTREAPDRLELNLFAAKPDRVAALAAEGLLINGAGPWIDPAGGAQTMLKRWHELGFAPAFPLTSARPTEPNYLRALVAYDAFRTHAGPERRVAALWFAFQVLVQLCRLQPTTARLLTLARVAADYGARTTAVDVLDKLAQLARQRPLDVAEPFWPPLERFDDIPAADPASWLRAACVEALELRRSHSSGFSKPLPDMDWLCATPLASAEMLRRQVLRAARAGEQAGVPALLTVASDDHRNAAIWAGGQVPGTRLPLA